MVGENRIKKGMPKKKGKGGKGHRRAKASRDDGKRALEFKEHGQEYAQITKMLGNGRVTAMCFDGTSRMCIIRGAMRKREWMGVGDIILVGLRDFQDSKADVIGKYTADEARNLKMLGELPANAKIGGGAGGDLGMFGDEEDDCAFDFEAI